MSTEAFILAQQPGIIHSLLVCALFALAAHGIGCLCIRRNDSISFAFGFFLTGTLFFLAQLFFPPEKVLLTAALPLLFAAAWVGFYFSVTKFVKNKLLFTAAVLFFALIAGSALLPPYSWDEQVYQIELLSRYAGNRSAAILMDNPYSAWPGFLQAFLLPGFISGGIEFPRLFNTLLTVILAGSLFSFIRPQGKKTAAVITAAVFLSPLALILSRSLYAENTVTLFAAAGLTALYRLRKKPAAAVLLAGIFAGAAAAVKLTSGGVVLALLLLCAFDRRNKKVLYLFFAGAFLAAAPWYLRVWLSTGNPFYPFAAAIFGTSAAVENHHYLLGSYRYGLGPLYGTVFGWITTAFYGKIYDGAVTGFQQIVMLALFFSAIRFGRKERAAAFLKRGGAAIGLMYLFWGMTSQQTRFLYPAFFFLAVYAAMAIRTLPRKTGNIFLILLLAGTFLSGDLYAQAKHFFISWRILSPARKEPLRFLAFAQKDPDFIQILEAAGKTPAKSRFILLYEKRGLYLPRARQIADPGFQEKFFKKIPANSEELMQELSGADYLIIGSNEKNVDLQEKEIALQEYMTGLVAEAVKKGRLSLVAVGTQNSCRLLKINNLTK